MERKLEVGLFVRDVFGVFGKVFRDFYFVGYFRGVNRVGFIVRKYMFGEGDREFIYVLGS